MQKSKINFKEINENYQSTEDNLQKLYQFNLLLTVGVKWQKSDENQLFGAEFAMPLRSVY